MKKILALGLVVFVALSAAACARVRNQAPTLTVSNQVVDGQITIQRGDEFNPLSLITASDKEDDNATLEVTMSGWEDAFRNSAGNYTVEFSVEDSKGLSAFVSIVVIVEDAESENTPPRLLGVQSEQVYYIGSNFVWEPKAGVTAIDDQDGDLTSQITTSGVYLLTAPGTYNITLRVMDSDEAMATANVRLIVRQSTVPTTLGSEQINVTFWHAMGAANQTLLQEYADEFKVLYPNINIVMQNQGGYDDLKNKTITSLTAGNQPTMLQGYPDHVSEYLNLNGVEVLDPYLFHPNYGVSDISDFIESYLDENTQYDAPGSFYSVPFNKSTEVFIYNKTVFQELGLDEPQSWQDVVVAAQAIRTWYDAQVDADTTLDQAQKDAKKRDMVPFSYDSSSNAFITFVRQWEGQYTGIEFPSRQGTYLFNNPQAIQAMSFYKQQVDAKLFTLPNLWEQTHGSEPFKAGLTYMTVGSSAGIRYNIPDPDVYDFEISVIPVPSNNGYRQVIQQGTNISIMRGASAQEKLAAWLFTQYITSTEVTARWAMSTGYLPVRHSAYNSTVYQNFLNSPTQEQKNFSLAANAAFAQRNDMFFDPAFVGSSKARAQVGIALERIVFNPEVTIQQAINLALQELQ